MPLATICGLPASGKTTFAEGLVAFLRRELKGQQQQRVVLVNEEALRIGKAQGYRDAAAEKETRGALRAAVDHALDKNTVVVLDSLNYIKGFRYQLYCAARAEATQHCVVWVDASDAELPRQWNAAREDGYPESLLDDLSNRFEPPNACSRWDRPLIRHTARSRQERGGATTGEEGPMCPSGQGQTEVIEGVYRQVLAALMEGRAAAASFSTAVAPRAEADALYVVDQTTQKVVASLLDRQATAMAGDRVQLAEASKPFLLSRSVGLPELKRLRRQFVKQASEWSACGQGKDREKAIADAFLDYVGTQIA